MKSRVFGWTTAMGASAFLLVMAGSLPVHAQHKLRDPYIPNDHRPLTSHSDKRQGHPHQAAPLQSKAAKKRTLICPVTGDKIASVKAAVGHSAYKGKTYYFCCPECKPRFDKNPAKYIQNAKKGIFEKM